MADAGSKMSFNETYDKGKDIADASLDDTLRSYMDSGDDFFMNETFDDSGRIATRRNVIDGVRNNLLQKMRGENQASVAAANRMAERHREYSENLARDIRGLRSLSLLIEQDRVKERLLSARTNEEDNSSLRTTLQNYISNLRNGANNPMLMDSLESEAGQEPEDGVDEERQALTREEEADLEALRNDSRNQLSFFQTALDSLDQKGTGHGAVYSFFHGLAARKSYRGGKTRSHVDSRNKKADAVLEKARKWEDIRSKYRQNVVERHYKAYDKLAKSYYQLTREVEQVNQPGSGRDLGNSGKDIREYTGTYELDGANGLRSLIAKFQGGMELPRTGAGDMEMDFHNEVYSKITADSLPVKDYKNRVGGADGVSAAAHIKSHRNIVMLSESGERYKLDQTFQGYMAKRQQDREGRLRMLAEAGNNPAWKQEKKLDRTQTTLEADKKDINGRYLVSEKSSEILDMRLSFSRRRARGFYLDGMFLSDTENVGEGDLGYFGNRSLEKQGKAEELRAAIRNSAFFQHVNAKTIQYYAGYNADEDYKLVRLDDAVNSVREKNAALFAAPEGAEEGAQEQLTNEQVFKQMRMNPDDNNMKQLSGSELGTIIAAYLRYWSRPRNEGEGNGNEGQTITAANCLTDPIVRSIEGKELLSSTCLALLSDDGSPDLWNIAYVIISNSSDASSHLKSKLKVIPRSGELMRMGLIDEICNHMGYFSDFNPSNPLAVLNPSSVTVAQEEANNRRGVGAWFARNFLNGTILSEAADTAMTGVMAYRATQVNEVNDMKEAADRAKKEREERGDTELSEAEKKYNQYKESTSSQNIWMSYSQTMAASTNLLFPLGFGAALAGGVFGGSGSGGGMELGMNATMTAGSIMSMVKDIYVVGKALVDLVKYLRSGGEENEGAQGNGAAAEAAAELLQHDSHPVLDRILNVSKSLLGLANSLRNVGSTWISTASSFGSAIGFGGPVMNVIGILTNLVGFVENWMKSRAMRHLKNRITEADSEIESALSYARPQGGGQPVPGNAAEQRKLDLAAAASGNSQAQYFMSMSRMNARKQMVSARFGMAKNVAGIAKSASGFFPPEPISKTILTIAPKVVQFIGWVTSIGYDRANYRETIARTLGDVKYKDAPYFDAVLKRETGIISSDYLEDLSRIFMSIDTHVLANKPNPDSGELDLISKVMGTIYSNIDEENRKQVKLKKLLEVCGFSSDSDWRQVLRSSIKAY